MIGERVGMSSAAHVSRPLSVLLIEDCEEDAELLVLELTRAGYDVTSERVQTADGMRAALDRTPFDVILSDYSMPEFSGPAALAIVQELGLDLPFLILSGSIGEETAVAALHAGAHDFLMKNRLARLAPAIERTRGDVQHRRARQHAEAALVRSERQYRALFEHAVFGIYQTRIDGRFLAVNPALVAMVGYACADELLRVPVDALFLDPEERRALALECMRQGTLSAETTWRRNDGREIRVRLNGRSARDPITNDPVLDVIVEDVTDQHGLQQQLRQAQRMEAIGQLAGGVAHDFNNMLTAILGYTELLTEQIGVDKPIGRDLREIQAAAERATALTRHLLAFSRKQVLAMAPVDLAGVVRSLEPMLRRVLDERVRIVTDPADVDPVMADATQLEHVLVNLAVNARDAMPDGGTLSIRTGNADIDDAFVRLHPGAAPGAYAALVVTDTGIGMTPEIQARIFEPFFTTKEVGRGTGLGLAAVFGTVKQLGGYIDVTSRPGRGTTFTIYLPRTAEHALPAAAPVMVSSPVGAETILLVEDEPGVRAFVTQALQRHGYRVVATDTGEAALSVFTGHPAPIHLVVTDVGLPGIDGLQLVDRVHHLQPAMPCLVVSGYADWLTEKGRVLAGNTHLLPKPFTGHTLLTKIREILGPVPGETR